MALTDAQKVDVRRWMGHQTLNPGSPDPVFSIVDSLGYSSLSLGVKLDGLTSAEEESLTTQYLTPLAALEAGLLAAAANMDTDTAGPWKANPREMQDRDKLYKKWRRDLCGFLGFAPGPALGSGGMTVVRC